MRVFRAQKVNQVMGGLAVMPWEVDELPYEWMDVFMGLTDELPQMEKLVKNQVSARDEWLKRSGYRSYLKKGK